MYPRTPPKLGWPKANAPFVSGSPHPSAKGKVAIGTGAAIAAALVIALPGIRQWEGKKNVTYLDVVGVPTACYGHTGNVGKVGTRWTDAQCEFLLDKDVRVHMDGALRCVPALGQRPQQLAAVTSLTFNIGVAAFCGSTAARRFNAGDWKGGCEAFTMWHKAGGRVIRGLVNRRAYEREICLKGLP